METILPFFTLLLLIPPIVFLFACKYFNLSGQAVRVSQLDTAMRPMVMAGAMTSIAGLTPRLNSAMAAYVILVSFFTLPLIYSWL